MECIGSLAQRVAGLPAPTAGPARPIAWFTLAARLVLAALFLWAGALKLSHPRAFAHVIDGYGIVPDGWPLVLAAFIVPGVEVLSGLGVLLNRRWGYLLMLGMLALFMGVLWFGILNDLDVDCGCFSLEERRGQASLKAAFIRDCFMAVAVAWCLTVKHRERRVTRPSETTNRGERE